MEPSEFLTDDERCQILMAQDLDETLSENDPNAFVETLLKEQHDAEMYFGSPGLNPDAERSATL